MYGTIAYFDINGSLEQKTNYTIRIKSGISDLKGNVSSVPIDFNFKTSDTIPPVVVEVTPKGLNIGYKTDLAITVYFNEEMDPGSLANSLQISDSNGSVNYIYLGYEERYYYRPPFYPPYNNLPEGTYYIAKYEIAKSNLREYMPYRINISGAKDVYGNLVQPNLYAEFRTASNTRPHPINYTITECNGKVQLQNRL